MIAWVAGLAAATEPGVLGQMDPAELEEILSSVGLSKALTEGIGCVIAEAGTGVELCRRSSQQGGLRPAAKYVPPPPDPPLVYESARGTLTIETQDPRVRDQLWERRRGLTRCLAPGEADRFTVHLFGEGRWRAGPQPEEDVAECLDHILSRASSLDVLFAAKGWTPDAWVRLQYTPRSSAE